ncbi:uncharacterized protein LY89DRAFT_285810 [Mollisia scopiformis]|uniref:Putative zinc-finger domain-containing protein n=1 Tax=Mollisia scopiformis TaxID=149040 RepID=A0A132BBH9_MOLSC|nr:uncharacterized protein LY89DRAFT_285810 [Mollisia scopiformis]KUJ09359.1 hypothetical protein LY89DRAFT_285810 [Mollisia scopiformis]
MSDYPSTPSYGANYGSRDQTNPPYIPASYPNQYMQPDDGRTAQGNMASHYDTSMSAYAYNRALPSFSAAAVASSVPPLPIYQGWNQDSIPLPPFNPPHNTAQYPSYGNNAQNGSQFYSSMGHTNYLPNAQPAKAYEQGELSEGEFEDGGLATNTPPAGYSTSQYGNGGTNYNDNSSHAGYAQVQDFTPQQTFPVNNYQYPTNPPTTQLKRQQSGSYSPYVSPAVGDRDDQYSNDKNINAVASNFAQRPKNSTTPSQYKTPSKAVNGPVKSSFQSNGYHTPQEGQHNTQPKPSPRHSTPSLAPSVGNVKTVAESRKKAENAILNLLPCDVRYQTYIDEGFREEIIGPLFDGLKLPRHSAKPSNSTPTQSAIQQSLHTSKSKTAVEQHAAAGGNISKAQSVPGARKEALELSIPSSSVTTQQSQSTAAPKSAAQTEKEEERKRTLQLKMEALRKSREERAQKQAAAAKDVAKPVDKPTEKPPAIETPIAEPELPETKPAASITASSLPLDTPSASKVQAPIAGDAIPSKSPAPPIVPEIRQQPSIPGLFLASNGIPGLQLSGSSTPVPSISTAQRKRPVAADFDDNLPAMAPFKRPFGHHRNDRPLVINVSEDEADSDDEDVAMDLDSAGDSPMQPERKMSGNQAALLQNSSQLFDKVNKTFTPPPFPSATNTPPLLSSNSRPVHSSPAELERKDREIRDLKRRIAEAEAKKRAKQTPSRTRTPRIPELNASEITDGQATNGSVPKKLDSPTKMQQLVTVAQSQVDADQQKLAEAQAAEAEKAAELVKNELEQKRLLREKNATNQSLVDAEVQQTRTKLEELKAAMAEAEAAYQKSLEEKQRLKEEAERLEQEAELQTKKDRLQDLTGQKVQATIDIASRSSADEASQQSAAPITPDLSSTSTSEEPGQIVDMAPTTRTDSEPLPTESGLAHDVSNVTQSPTEPEEQVDNTQDKEEVVDCTSTDQAMEAALQEAVRADVDLQTAEDDDDVEMDMDMEDSYAPDPNHLAPESVPGVVLEDEGNSEYSPVLDRTVPEIQTLNEIEDQDEIQDDYEPPEAIAPVEDSIPYSPPFSPAPPEQNPEPVMDEPMDIQPPNPASPAFVPETNMDEVNDVNTTQARSEKGQNYSGELLPSVIGSSPNLVEPGSEDDFKTPLYTPYESPLKRFRAYRFHPEFSRDVAGGLKSRTYSHKIDPNKEFCRYELAGGTCNDSTCASQHFDRIGLQDDAVLTALGSPEEFKDEQRDKFCEGLKGVLMDLRVRKIRDFDVIASEIVAHRARFLGDPSKVLALDGTTI